MPHSSEVHVNAALSTFAAGYTNGEYIADAVCPVIESDKASDKYQKFLREDATTALNDLIGANGEANEADYSITTGTFLCKDRGLKGYVTNKEIRNADDPHRPLERRVTFLQNLIALGREIRVATLVGTTGSYAAANTGAVSNTWDDDTSGTPLVDIHAAVAAIAPGMQGETQLVMVLALEVWQALQRHPDMRGGGTERPVVSIEEAQSILGIDRIVVSDAQKQTANLGPTARTYARVWTATQAAILRVPVGEPADETGLFCCTFRHDDGFGPTQVRTWDEPKRGKGGSVAVQVELSDAEVVVQNDMGYLMTSVL